MARVSTYLNFTRSTEEAFLFYKEAFQTEFNGPIMRFGEAPPQPGAPPMSEEDKNLVLHVELPVTGGHILMGTDAPESWGFTLNFGNNAHIMLETDTREECDRLFNALSVGGKVSMPPQDMFWGSYFGSFSDKFGVMWMVSHTPEKPVGS